MYKEGKILFVGILCVKVFFKVLVIEVIEVIKWFNVYKFKLEVFNEENVV